MALLVIVGLGLTGVDYYPEHISRLALHRLLLHTPQPKVTRERSFDRNGNGTISIDHSQITVSPHAI
jgi:hypothetical protein